MLSRRQFLRRSALIAGVFLFPDIPPSLLRNRPLSQPAPAPLGRIATWHWQTVHAEPSLESEELTWKTYDEIIPLRYAIEGEAPWPSNPIWYRTTEGFIHSGFVQPVKDAPQGEVVRHVREPGFWAQVTVPIAETRWEPGGGLARKLYYGTVYRVVETVYDEDGTPWYRLQEGLAWSPGPYVLASSLRHISAAELLPLSPGRTDKWIQIDLANQNLACFEGDTPVFATRISSGASGTRTPPGEYHVLYKRHTQRMTGGEGEDAYDLPGVPFPTYFTDAGHAIHGTYWHNDFGQPHSHGCVNVPNDAAQWVFCWSEPAVPYSEHTRRFDRGSGTLIVIV